MTIPALFTTGKLVRGGSASKTLRSPTLTCQWASRERTMDPVLWGCRPAKSSVFVSMWDKFHPKSKIYYKMVNCEWHI